MYSTIILGYAKAHLRSFNAHSRACQIARFTPDGKAVVSAADDGIVRLWDISQGEKISDLPVHSGKKILIKWGAPSR